MKLQEAYNNLSDPIKQALYDLERYEARVNQLEAENAELRRTLRPFADEYGHFEEQPRTMTVPGLLTVAHLARAYEVIYE